MKINSLTQRIESIDLLRGLVIIIMALDHVRDYFHTGAYFFDPTDLSQTSVAVFGTRWITHFCAPVFVFLAGTSAYLIGVRKGIPALSSFLVKRGLWLIVLELTLINFAWFFNIHFSFIALTVIWVLGLGMIVLAMLVRLPFRMILIFSVLLIVGHNALDGFHVKEMGFPKVIWGLLHDQEFMSTSPGRYLFIGYSLIPWVAVMSLGYCFGSLYAPGSDPERRIRLLKWMGFIAIMGFVVLRATNLYGDPRPWSVQNSPVFSILSFLNCNKYPPSLLYLLMTLGPAMFILAFTEKSRSWLTGVLIVVGRVPLFFYVVHIYVVHLIALIAAILTGFPPSIMVFNNWITNGLTSKGYGFDLAVVYVIWVIVLLILYPLCKWFDAYKRANKDKVWVSYV